MLAAVAHTTGINWTAVGVISGVVSTVMGIVGKWLNGRLGKQDTKIDTHGQILADTRVSVARIEGYMARQNGQHGQGRTPDLLPDLPTPIVVPPKSDIIVP